MNLYERALDDERRFEHLVVIEDVWRNHFIQIAEVHINEHYQIELIN